MGRRAPHRAVVWFYILGVSFGTADSADRDSSAPITPIAPGPRAGSVLCWESLALARGWKATTCRYSRGGESRNEKPRVAGRRRGALLLYRPSTRTAGRIFLA